MSCPLKNLKLKPTYLIAILLSLISIDSFSQSNTASAAMGTIVSSGVDSSGDYGSVSYSIGQVFYTYIGTKVYNVAQGIQHQDTSLTLDLPEVVDAIETKIAVFPNPTTDYVTVNLGSVDALNNKVYYQVYDLQGRMMTQNKIDQLETQINLSYLSSSTYLLRVFTENKIIKVFKIIKN